MGRITNENKQMLYPSPPVSPLPSFPRPNYESSSSSSNSIRISPVLLLIIVIFAVIFFLAGVVHLLIRFVIKRASFSPIYQSNRYPGDSESAGFQRQLQQLFRLHDSGLDQSVIDALPVFYYKDIMGLKDPFDCAVCLCEFLTHDKLRLLPACSHAFHIQCIDTWLLSNSTCPLCRATLSGTCFPLAHQNPIFQRDYLTDVGSDRENGISDTDSQKKPSATEDFREKRVFPVRLGKFTSSNVGESVGGRAANGEITSCKLDGRRCYSMGAYQYVVGDLLQVTLSPATVRDHQKLKTNDHGSSTSSVAGTTAEDVEDHKGIRRRREGESFSVSKIWLWSKKSTGFAAASSDNHSGVSPTVSLPWNYYTTQAV